MPTWNKISFSDASSPIMEQMIMFHDHSMMILVLITILVLYMMISTVMNTFMNKALLEGQEIETFWTIVPALLLIFIALPSLQILYLMDELENPNMTIKGIGHQWYWSYEYSDFENLEFDSYMLSSELMNMSSFRLLDVDNRVIIPSNLKIRMFVTSTDVIHSWTVPSLGVKSDATPGRINQVLLFSTHLGLLYGQCSEICGANHSFMPIVLEVIPLDNFISWVKNY